MRTVGASEDLPFVPGVAKILKRFWAFLLDLLALSETQANDSRRTSSGRHSPVSAPVSNPVSLSSVLSVCRHPLDATCWLIVFLLTSSLSGQKRQSASGEWAAQNRNCPTDANGLATHQVERLLAKRMPSLERMEIKPKAST